MALLALHPRLSARGEWKARLSWPVHRSPPLSKCSMTHWPRSTATSSVRFRLVREKGSVDLVRIPSVFLRAHLPSPCIAPQLLSHGNVDATVLQVEVAWVREAVATTEAARAAVMLATEASTHKATTALNSATLCIREVEDQVVVAERDASERESQVDVEHSVALARSSRGESPYLRVSLRRSAGSRKHLRGSTEHASMSSPSYRLKALSSATPLSALLKHDIYSRGCGTQPSAILRWLRSLLWFGLWCPLSWSRCSCACPAIPPILRW
jgi:hypothetical protein